MTYPTSPTYPTTPEAVAQATVEGRPQYRWVYLWRWPLRVTHWISAACIVALAITGLYIGSPYMSTWGQASGHFLMGKVRFAHFLAGALIVGAAILRMYWLFAGGRYASWRGENVRAYLPRSRGENGAGLQHYLGSTFWLHHGRRLRYACPGTHGKARDRTEAQAER